MADAARASVDAYVAEVITWKFAGASAWHGALFLGAACTWFALAPLGSPHVAGLLYFSTWLQLLALYLLCFGVLLAQRRLLAAMDVPPLRLPRLGLNSKSWLLLFVTRCIIRQRRLADVLAAAAFYAACAASGAYCLVSFSAPARAAGGQRHSWQEMKWLLLYGGMLGWLYATIYLVRTMNVLSYPILQRKRFFRVRSRLRAMARSALVLPTIALLLALLATAAASPFGQFLEHLPPATLLIRSWRAAVLVAFAWVAGANMLEVVFTEAVAFADADAPAPTLPLLLGLQHSNPTVQDWALLDLVSVAEGAPGAALRRAALFADETGSSGWIPVVSYCLAEVDDLAAVVAASLPSLTAAAKSAGTPAAAGSEGGDRRGTAAAAAGEAGGGVRWNALQVSSTGAKALSAEQDLAVWHLQARFYRAAWSIRALAGLAAASLREDAYGVAQLSSPGLAHVVMALLQVVGALQQSIKAMSSVPARTSPGLLQLNRLFTLFGKTASPACGPGLSSQHVDHAAWALLDVAKTAVYTVTSTFGPVLAGALKAAGPSKGPLAPPEAAALLSSFLQIDE